MKTSTMTKAMEWWKTLRKQLVSLFTILLFNADRSFTGEGKDWERRRYLFGMKLYEIVFWIFKANRLNINQSTTNLSSLFIVCSRTFSREIDTSVISKLVNSTETRSCG